MTQPAASFRDPAGSCCQIDGRILRLLDAVTAAGYEAFLETASARGLAQAGKLVSTRRLPGSEAAALRPLPQLQAALARLASRYAGQAWPSPHQWLYPGGTLRWSPSGKVLLAS